MVQEIIISDDFVYKRKFVIRINRFLLELPILVVSGEFSALRDRRKSFLKEFKNGESMLIL